MAKSKDTRRRLNPAEVHRLWSAIIKCQERSPNEPILIEKLRQHFDNDEQLLDVLTKGIDEKLIIANTDNLKLPNGEQPEYPCEVSLPPKNDIKPKHDWYCFHCHRIDSQHYKNDTSSVHSSESDANSDGQAVEELSKCHECFKSFHQSCAKRYYTYVIRLESDNRANFDDEYQCTRSYEICLLCLLKREHSRPFSIKDKDFTAEVFNEILSYTFCPFIEDRPKKKNHIIYQTIEEFHQRSKEDVIPEDSAEVACTKLALRHLVHDFIDAGTIQDKLQNRKYENVAQYFDDCLKLGHVFEIVFIAGGQTKIGRMKDFKSDLNDIFDEMRHDFKDIFACINCYLLSNRDSDDDFWFSQTCDPPHCLVFAKQKGYPYWPAKVITPRVVEDIKSVKKFEVRFFGGNHERFVVDQAYVKDIDSPINELGINIKANSGIEKALQELRIHRDLLEGKAGATQSGNLRRKRKSINSKDDSKVDKTLKEEKKKNIKVQRTRRRKTDDDDEAEENIDDDDDDDNNKEDTLTNDQTNKHEISNGNGTVSPTPSQQTEITDTPIRLKRERRSARSLDGYETDFSVKRKRKLESSGTETESVSGDETIKDTAKRRRNSEDTDLRKKTMKESIKNRKKMENLIEDEEQSEPEEAEQDKDNTEKEDEDEQTDNEESDNAQEEEEVEDEDEAEEEEDEEAEDEEEEKEKIVKKIKKTLKKEIKVERRKRGRPRKVPSNIVQNGHHSNNDEDGNDEEDGDEVFVGRPRRKSLSTRNERNQNRNKSPIMSDERRNRKQTERFSPIKIDMNLTVPPRKRGRPSKAYLELVETEKSQVEKERQQVIQNRKKIVLPVYTPTVTAKRTEAKSVSLYSPIFKLPPNFDFSELSKPNGDPDNSDDEDYPFDDEQLEQEIQDYEEFKEQSLRWRQSRHYSMQNSLHSLQQRHGFGKQPQRLFYPNHASRGSFNDSINREQRPNGGLFIPDVPETYIDFPSEAIYLPNNKTKRMLNYYIHEAKTNPENGISRGDVLANFYLRRDGLTDDLLDEYDAPEDAPKKKGRPPKVGGEADEIAKAKISLEKSYLQDTACDRECLQKNAKAFKKFRLFASMQNKEEHDKMKQQIQELTDKLRHMERTNYELQSRVMNQTSGVHQFNPDVLNILQQKITETKREIWCTNCLSHRGIYHCCFNVHYCSTACQADHWPKHFHTCLQRKGITSYKRDDMMDKAVSTTISYSTASSSTAPNASISSLGELDELLSNGQISKLPSKFSPKKGKPSPVKSPKKAEVAKRKKKKNLLAVRKKKTAKVDKTAASKGKKGKKAVEEVRVKRKYVRKNLKVKEEKATPEGKKKRGRKPKKIKEEVVEEQEEEEESDKSDNEPMDEENGDAFEESIEEEEDVPEENAVLKTTIEVLPPSDNEEEDGDDDDDDGDEDNEEDDDNENGIDGSDESSADENEDHVLNGDLLDVDISKTISGVELPTTAPEGTT